MGLSKNTDAIITGGISVSFLVVMYIVILKYRLPYAQVLLAYVILKIIEAIYRNVIRHRIITGDNSPLTSTGMTLGVMDLLLLFISFIGVPIIAAYRFSALQVAGVFATGYASGSIADAVIQRL